MFSCSHKKILQTESIEDINRLYLEGDVDPYNGICIINFKNTNQAKEERTFAGGKLQGEAISYYHNGTILRKGSYNKGEFDGKWEAWYENGSKKFEITYSAGMLTGQYQVWYQNGKIKEHGEYLNNKKISTWQYYDPNGQLIRETTYNN